MFDIIKSIAALSRYHTLEFEFICSLGLQIHELENVKVRIGEIPIKVHVFGRYGYSGLASGQFIGSWAVIICGVSLLIQVFLHLLDLFLDVIGLLAIHFILSGGWPRVLLRLLVLVVVDALDSTQNL